MNYQEATDKAKATALILGVAGVGMALFLLIFSYLYKGALDLGACGLCFKLNPGMVCVP